MPFTSLLCRIGWHAPLPGGRWNGGYCFTSCRRCGRDMVRSAFGEWHVPKGFRVVWGAAAPQDLGAALDARDGDAGVIARQDRTTNQASALEPAPVSVPQPDPPPAEPPPADPPPPDLPLTEPSPPSPAASPRARSPFDFDDFDALEPAPVRSKRSKRRHRR